MKDVAHDTLSEFCKQLIDSCNSIQSNSLSTPSDDHLGFMIATFAARQLDQLHGIGYLIQGESHAQAGILACSMLKGLPCSTGQTPRLSEPYVGVLTASYKTFNSFVRSRRRESTSSRAMSPSFSNAFEVTHRCS